MLNLSVRESTNISLFSTKGTPLVLPDGVTLLGKVVNDELLEICRLNLTKIGSTSVRVILPDTDLVRGSFNQVLFFDIVFEWQGFVTRTKVDRLKIDYSPSVWDANTVTFIPNYTREGNYVSSATPPQVAREQEIYKAEEYWTRADGKLVQFTIVNDNGKSGIKLTEVTAK